jgi:hypothetical protein
MSECRQLIVASRDALKTEAWAASATRGGIRQNSDLRNAWKTEAWAASATRSGIRQNSDLRDALKTEAWPASATLFLQTL